MHFKKLGSSDNNMSLLTATVTSASLSSSSSASSSSSSLLSPPLPSQVSGCTLSSISSPSSTATARKTKRAKHGLNLGLWWLLFMAAILMAQQQPCECRYLPTRSHGDDLDKLRELILQILNSSNEDGGAQQRPPNEANGNTLAAAAAAAQRANWLNKLGGNIDSVDVSRKYNAPRGIYDNGRYY